MTAFGAGALRNEPWPEDSHNRHRIVALRLRNQLIRRRMTEARPCGWIVAGR
jgi:hypothetical protein